MTLLGLSSPLEKNDSAWVVIGTKMTLLGLSSSLDKNDSAWVVIVHGQK